MNQNIRDGGNTMKIIDNVTAFSEDKYLSDKGYGEFKFAGTITVTDGSDDIDKLEFALADNFKTVRLESVWADDFKAVDSEECDNTK